MSAEVAQAKPQDDQLDLNQNPLKVQVAAQPSDIDLNWSEIRLSGKLPERRSNHCSFIVNDYLYIHGGRDIKEGPMSNMWRLSIQGIQGLIEDPSFGVSWEPVQCKGTQPGKLSHHKSALYGHSVVFFGGICGYDDSQDSYNFDSTTHTWTKLKQTGTIPKPRDDHSLSQICPKTFLIYGGFVEGSRVNDCYIAKKNGNTLEWKLVEIATKERPCPRASHSTVVYGRNMYLFGGQDDDNNKLNDLWEFNIDTGVYKEIVLPADSVIPVARSGHSANIFNGQMYIFGGILELTKELNEMLVFDFKTGKFSCADNVDALADLHNGASNIRKLEEGSESPGLKMKKQMTMGGQSPTKLGGTYGGSPSKLNSKSPTKKTTKKLGKSPKKKTDAAADDAEKKESGLASPTSISMQNSFIIKNADESFEAYFQQMRRRKLGGAGNTMDHTMGGQSATLQGMGGSPGIMNSSNFGVVEGIQPAARDGHSTEISENGLMFVFGGDRHHMPFNDLYLMKLN